MQAQVSFISDFKHGLNQTYDQTLIEKVRYDQQHMIQQYFNEIANSKQQSEETRRLIFEK